MLRFRHIKNEWSFWQGLRWRELVRVVKRGGWPLDGKFFDLRPPPLGREFRPEGKSVLYDRCSANTASHHRWDSTSRTSFWSNPALGSPLTKFLDPPLCGINENHGRKTNSFVGGKCRALDDANLWQKSLLWYKVHSKNRQ